MRLEDQCAEHDPQRRRHHLVVIGKTRDRDSRGGQKEPRADDAGNHRSLCGKHRQEVMEIGIQPSKVMGIRYVTMIRLCRFQKGDSKRLCGVHLSEHLSSLGRHPTR